MIIKMTLLSDAIFGNGMSIPGAEDISVLCDDQGFPYYKGGTFKGIFREELERLLAFQGLSQAEAESRADELLGYSGEDTPNFGKLIFSDFTLAKNTKEKVLATVNDPEEIKALTTNIRTFTAIEGDGLVKTGSLRMARCVDKGLSFYSKLVCREADRALVEETLSMIKWIGTMRNRGFGCVKISIVQEGENI